MKYFEFLLCIWEFGYEIQQIVYRKLWNEREER